MDSWRPQLGSAAVELLVVAVGLLAFTAGLMGIGRLTATRAALASVAREAAGWPPMPPPPPRPSNTARRRGRLGAAATGWTRPGSR